MAILQRLRSDPVASLARSLAQLAKAAEVGFRDGSGSLHLDAGDGAAHFHHDVDLEVVAVSEVKELDRHWTPTCLSSQFLQDECFQHRTEERPVVVQACGVEPQQGAGNARVADVEFRSLH